MPASSSAILAPNCSTWAVSPPSTRSPSRPASVIFSMMSRAFSALFNAAAALPRRRRSAPWRWRRRSRAWSARRPASRGRRRSSRESPSSPSCSLASAVAVSRALVPPLPSALAMASPAVLAAGCRSRRRCSISNISKRMLASRLSVPCCRLACWDARRSGKIRPSNGTVPRDSSSFFSSSRRRFRSSVRALASVRLAADCSPSNHRPTASTAPPMAPEKPTIRSLRPLSPISRASRLNESPRFESARQVLRPGAPWRRRTPRHRSGAGNARCRRRTLATTVVTPWKVRATLLPCCSARIPELLQALELAGRRIRHGLDKLLQRLAGGGGGVAVAREGLNGGVETERLQADERLGQLLDRERGTAGEGFQAGERRLAGRWPSR